jgi:hypothetical protein
MREPVFSDLVGLEGFESLYEDHVIELVGEGIVTGMGDGTFAPFANTTRAHFATLVTRIFGIPEVEYKGYFLDVLDGDWYAGAIEALAELGYGRNSSDGKFRPNDAVTYEDTVVLAYMLLNDNGLLPDDNKRPNTIDDSVRDSLSDYARVPYDELYARDLVVLSKYLNTPHGLPTRGDTAIFMNHVRRYISNLG